MLNCLYSSKENKMSQSTKAPLFEDFMASSVVVSYPCNKHACKNGTKPKMITKKDLAGILASTRCGAVKKEGQER